MSQPKLTVTGHLRELRQRLIYSVIAIAITTAVSFVFAKSLFAFLLRPAGGFELVFIEMTEMLGTYMKVCLTSGVILAMPFLIYQFLMFVSPALTRKEKRSVYLVLPFIGAMFIGGVLFGYFVLLPPAINILFSFGSDIVTPQIRIGNYISLVSRLLLAIGLVFEMPVVVSFLSRLGVISPDWLARKRKAAFILAFILGAIITPTFDPINQTFVAVPLVLLYEMSIWLSRIFYKKGAPATAGVPSTVES